MDLLNIIRTKIAGLPEGGHSVGLRAVLQHIERAFQHLARGEAEDDEAYFTDTIYRTNQAFEGSLKEAYRVLAGKDPAHETTAKIEKYLEHQNIFKKRVLDQLQIYRREWRNKSTHDYSLYFDESEAFLAIISVSAFVKLLVDQIEEKLSFDAGQNVVADTPPTMDHTGSFRELLADLCLSFMNSNEQWSGRAAGLRLHEAAVQGLLAGYLSSVLPNATITPELSVGERSRVDLAVSFGNETVFIELKRFGGSPSAPASGVDQLLTYLDLAQISDGILLLYSDRHVLYRHDYITFFNQSITIISPQEQQ